MHHALALGSSQSFPANLMKTQEDPLSCPPLLSRTVHDPSKAYAHPQGRGVLLSWFVSGRAPSPEGERVSWSPEHTMN